MTFEIRPTTEGDAEGLQALVGAVALERRYLGATQPFTVEQTRSYLAHVRAGDGVALVATIGYLGMGVAADVRGQGIGPALLREALRGGFARFARIELEVFASNTRAHALYLRMGFVEEGRRRHARVIDDTTDDILMLDLLREEWLARSHPRP